MKDLPADVSLASPVEPRNDVFTVIQAKGETTPPLMEEITLPVNRKLRNARGIEITSFPRKCAARTISSSEITTEGDAHGHRMPAGTLA